MKGGDKMDILSFIAVTGYTVTIFALGYTWGKDFEFRQVVFKTARPVPGYDEESKL